MPLTPDEWLLVESGCPACRDQPDVVQPPAWCDRARTQNCRRKGHVSRHYNAVDGYRYCAPCVGAAWYRAQGGVPVGIEQEEDEDGAADA